MRLEQAGAVILGKTNCDEFAMGSSNENSAFGPVRNPVAPDRVPGGSSGGSGAVVAQGTAVVALGSDTGGSIRQPASFCGVVGITPTYGRVSRYGLIAFASSLDHIGPFARNVKDAAQLLQVIAGRDEMDSTSAFAPVADYAGLLDGKVKGLRIGLPREYFQGAGERDRRPDRARRRDAPQAGLRRPAKSACRPPTTPSPATTSSARRRPAPTWRATTACATRRAPKDPATLIDMYRTTRGEGFGAECKRRIMLGTYVLSAGYYDAYYLKAQKVRALIARDFARAFERGGRHRRARSRPFPAFKLGEKIDDPLEMYLSDIYTHHRIAGGHPVHERAVRHDGRGSARGNADPHAALRRDGHAAPGRRLRAGGRRRRLNLPVRPPRISNR